MLNTNTLYKNKHIYKVISTFCCLNERLIKYKTLIPLYIKMFVLNFLVNLEIIYIFVNNIILLYFTYKYNNLLMLFLPSFSIQPFMMTLRKFIIISNIYRCKKSILPINCFYKMVLNLLFINHEKSKKNILCQIHNLKKII